MRVSRIHSLWALCALSALPLAAAAGESSVDRKVAADANVKMLALVHISSRYHVKASLEEAEAHFGNVVAPRDFDLVELPYEERGGPRLIDGGAKKGESGPPPG